MVTVWGGFGPDHTVPSTPRPLTGTYSYLLTYLPYRINGETFAVGTSTACKVFKQFILAVIEVGTGRMGAHRMF